MGPELAWPALELGLREPHKLQEARVGLDATVVTLVQLRQPVRTCRVLDAMSSLEA
jgi:hypothetical protein